MSPVLLDAGCGEGYYTSALSAAISASGGRTAGVDLSKTALKKAARACPGAEFAVASVYRIPMTEDSADIVLNCFAPLADAEYRRVLRPGGFFIYVVPGPGHLFEMKEILYDSPYENACKTEEYPGFVLMDTANVDTLFTLTQRDDILSLFRMTPYAWKTPKAGVERLASTEVLGVTAQFRIFIYRKDG